MANIHKAIRWLEDGESIGRRSWPQNTHIWRVMDGLAVMIKRPNEERIGYEFTYPDLLAEDWEIWEWEEDNG